MKIRYGIITMLMTVAVLAYCQEDPTEKMEGTWLFVSAKAGEKDVSSDYVFGLLDGEARKMTLQKGGALIYEDEVVSQLKITKGSWSVELNEAGTTYYLNMETGMDHNAQVEITGRAK